MIYQKSITSYNDITTNINCGQTCMTKRNTRATDVWKKARKVTRFYTHEEKIINIWEMTSAIKI